MKNVLLGLMLILTMLSLSGCSTVASFIDNSYKTLQDFELLLQNSEANYNKLQRNFGCEQTDKDTTTTKEYSKPTARP